MGTTCFPSKTLWPTLNGCKWGCLVFYRKRLEPRVLPWQQHSKCYSNLVPRASFPLTSGRKTRALGASISGMRHGYHTCRLRTAHPCAVKPDMQNSVISIVIWKWMLPELSFSDRWSRGTKLWERDWCYSVSLAMYHAHAGAGIQNISRVILDWKFCCFSETTYDVITIHFLHNTKTWISPKCKKVCQKGKRHSSFFWKAFQTGSNCHLLHRYLKVPLTPKFFFLCSKSIHNLVKIKKKLTKSIKSSRNCECLKLWCSGSRPRNRRSGANTLVTSAGEADFLAFEAIVWLAGFHLKFLAFKSYEAWPQPPKSLNSPRNDIKKIQIRIIRLSSRSLIICSLPENSIEDIEVTPSKSGNRKSVRMSV